MRTNRSLEMAAQRPFASLPRPTPVARQLRRYRSKTAIAVQASLGFAALDMPFIDVERLQYRKGWWNDYISKNMEP